MNNIKQKPPKTDIFAAILFGFGISFAFFPFLITSLIVKENLFLMVFDKMDGFWRSRGWK